MASVVTLAAVVTIGSAPFKRELQVTIAINSVLLFAFLFGALFKGFRVYYHDVKYKDLADGVNLDWTNVADAVPDAGGDETITGGIVLWFVVTVLIILASIAFSFFVAGVLFVLFWTLNWVFYRSLRLVFKKGRLCRGSVTESLKYSFLYTVLYSGWIVALIEIKSRLV
jgi:hypothetical protein